MFKFIFLLALVNTSYAADIKDEFIDAVSNQCSMSKDEAKKYATAGRTGNIMKFKFCATGSIEINDKCTIKCKKAGGSL